MAVLSYLLHCPNETILNTCQLMEFLLFHPSHVWLLLSIVSIKYLDFSRYLTNCSWRWGLQEISGKAHAQCLKFQSFATAHYNQRSVSSDIIEGFVLP